MDKWFVQDEIFPILQAIPSREPAVLMSSLGEHFLQRILSMISNVKCVHMMENIMYDDWNVICLLHSDTVWKMNLYVSPNELNALIKIWQIMDILSSDGAIGPIKG